MFNYLFKFWPLLIPLSLTLLSLVSWIFSINVIGPFDPRTGEEIAWLTLSMPIGTQIIEPFMSLSHLIFGAPNFRTAILSMGCWLFVIVFIVAIKNGRDSGWIRRYSEALITATVSFWLLLIYVLFVMVHHIPGWTLSGVDDASVVVDFQSHTEGSQDGIVSIAKSLEWHDTVGFDVVAITEHWIINNKLDEIQHDDQSTLPSIIVGVEVDNENNDYLIGLGLNPQKPIPASVGRDTKQFIETVHNKHQGAVTAMTWELDAERVDGLVNAGIDAIEIANSGHPYIYEDTRRKVLEVSEEHGLPLIGSTDWHGWTGFTRVWTIFQHQDLPQTSRSDRGQLVVNELRNRNREAFIPVIAGAVGGDSLIREIFTPFYEWGRYGMELSLQRLLVWWLWAAILTLLLIKQRVWLIRTIVFGVPIFLSGGIVLRGYELSQRAKLTPDDFFIRILPGQLYIAVSLAVVGLFILHLLNRKRAS